MKRETSNALSVRETKMVMRGTILAHLHHLAAEHVEIEIGRGEITFEILAGTRPSCRASWRRDSTVSQAPMEWAITTTSLT